MRSISLHPALPLLIFGVSVVAPLGSSQSSATRQDSQRLMAIERQINDADARHDAESMANILDDGYLIKSSDGKVFDKAATLTSVRLEAAEAKKAAKPSSPAVDLEGLNATTIEGSGLAVSSLTMDLGERKLHCRMTDTFIKRDDGWKLVSRVAACH